MEVYRILWFCNWVFGFVEDIGMVIVGKLNKGGEVEGWLVVIGVGGCEGEVKVCVEDIIGVEYEVFFEYWVLNLFKWVDKIISCCLREEILLDGVLVWVMFVGWCLECLIVL